MSVGKICAIMIDAMVADPEKNKVICYGVDFTEQVKKLIKTPIDADDYDQHLDALVSDVKKAMKSRT